MVVVINPNNPLTDTFSISKLIDLQKCCEKQHALLIIDEAFADIFEAEFSFVTHLSNTDDVIVLRSFGKFFGLAGLRIGFVCSSQFWCEIIQDNIGPWSINGPALYIAELALKDQIWQKQQVERLQIQSNKMVELLKKQLPSTRIEANALFVTVFIENAALIYQQFCEHSVYVRLTDEQNALRFGIADPSQLQMLTANLAHIG